jgi:hypothetical protein
MKTRTKDESKCLAGTVPDTFSARSADLTGLKMIRITRGVSFDFALRLVASSATACHPASLILTRASSHHLPGAWLTTR